ncbi:hypothetical protein Y032_0067g61 [Ancylostoma ceylanicum]|uniref:Uncharacterized protein n=1 Tax=Ancylostoma ceylanicum TaxID=53326 RepID=A0A016TYU2_9BILA|nr:hypothetical protein Y032_0067g61 [Ancylostoma ceylanicum]
MFLLDKALNTLCTTTNAFATIWSQCISKLRSLVIRNPRSLILFIYLSLIHLFEYSNIRPFQNIRLFEYSNIRKIFRMHHSIRPLVRRCDDQGFGSRVAPRFCKFYAAYPHDRCTYPTNTRTKSSPDGSVVERRVAIRPYRWFHSAS